MVSYTSSTGKVRDVKGLEGWERNAAGMWFNPTYGFGLIDVNKALELAANHQPLPRWYSCHGRRSMLAAVPPPLRMWATARPAQQPASRHH